MNIYLNFGWLQEKKNKFLHEWAIVQLKEVKKQIIRKYKDDMYYLVHKNVVNGRINHKMEHLACFAGGLYALASQNVEGELKNEFLDVSKGIAKFCHLMYTRNPTGLPTEYVIVNEDIIKNPRDAYGKHYLMRPEAIESWFILWRITGDPIYRDWAWDFFEAINLHTKSRYGYCGLKDATSSSPVKDDVQQSFFLAETLKYLYLIFSPDSVIPLDRYVFNTEAHPLPIIDFKIDFDVGLKNWVD